jgi:Mce-associated membrane protein
MTIDHHARINEADDVTVDEDDEAVRDSKPARKRLRRVRRVMAASRRWLTRLVARWRIIALTAAVVAAVGLAGGLFFFQYRPMQQTDNTTAQVAIKAASDGTVAVLSYAPGTVDNDLTLAKAHLTGDFLKYFNDFGRYFLAPAVRQQDVKASATVVRAAMVEIHPDSAVVLLFVHQTSTSKAKPEPVLTTNSVRVTLAKVDGSWLISKFEPV